MGLFATLSTNDTQHNNTAIMLSVAFNLLLCWVSFMLKIVILSVTMLSIVYAENRYAECRYAECRGAHYLP